MSRPHYVLDMLDCITPVDDRPRPKLRERPDEEPTPVPPTPIRREQPLPKRKITNAPDTREDVLAALKAGACTTNDVLVAVRAKGRDVSRQTIERHLGTLASERLVRRHDLQTTRDIERAGGRFLWEVAT